MFRALEASASALTAERLRMELIAQNLANAHSTRTADGGPYRRQVAIFAPRAAFGDLLRAALARQLPVAVAGRAALAPAGVQVVGVVEDPSPLRRIYDPGHPDADAEGYVTLPNVDPVEEMVNLVAATRAYEANVAAFNAAKEMALRALELGR